MEENKEELKQRFYETVEKEARKPYYLRLKELDEGQKKVLEALWELRYDGKKHLLSKSKDCFLEAFFDLLFVENSLSQGFGFGRLKKEISRIAKALGLYEYGSYRGEQAAAFEREYANAARYFITLGLEDSVYRSGVLHVVRLEDAKIKKKLARDLYAVSVKIPQRFGAQDLFAPFSAAAEDAYAAIFPEIGRCFGYVCENKG
ncbi:MAG: DUF6553 family protein [Blautia sp.]|jgi:hypothetical protein